MQVRLRTSKHFKALVIAVCLCFCFVDVLGALLFIPAGPILCQQADVSGGAGPAPHLHPLLLAARVHLWAGARRRAASMDSACVLGVFGRLRVAR